MNKNLYEKIMNKIKSSTIDDLEQSLRDFGFEVERKITCWNTKEIFNFLNALPQQAGAVSTVSTIGVDKMLGDLEYLAVNDNSYALAA